MSLTEQPAAYADCYALYELAADTPGGVRKPFATEPKAKIYQLRMHKARAIMRTQSRRAYPGNHQLYDTSPYDHLTASIKHDGEEYWLYVKPTIVDLREVEPIEEGVSLPRLNSPPLQLTHAKDDL